jgi:hypothetical protein
MTRVAGWLRVLLLASLLAGPRIAVQPADGPAPASWLADDGFNLLPARPAQHLRLLVPSLARSASPHRAAVHALPALPPSAPGGGSIPSDAESILQFRSAAHGVGSPPFPTGPPALPID